MAWCCNQALRLGGHFGPVFEATDPVLGLINCFGAHVSRTARIEPVVPPGEVYVSEAFAARLALSHDIRLTQKLVLQPQTDLNLYSKADHGRHIGAGLSGIDAGLHQQPNTKSQLSPASPAPLPGWPQPNTDTDTRGRKRRLPLPARSPASARRNKSLASPAPTNRIAVPPPTPPRAPRPSMNSAAAPALNEAHKANVDDPQTVASAVIHAIAGDRRDLTAALKSCSNLRPDRLTARDELRAGDGGCGFRQHRQAASGALVVSGAAQPPARIAAR
mgnify:CR=1 FL=1